MVRLDEFSQGDLVVVNICGEVGVLEENVSNLHEHQLKKFVTLIREQIN